MNCRICSSPITGFALSLPAPGMTSLTTPIDAPTQVAICDVCGHGQSPDPVELKAFYDNEYRISLQSDDFDQLYAMIDGKPVFRTDRQLGVLLDLADVKAGMQVLDYGAAKAQSLKRLADARPGIVPHVFDVSQDYAGHWQAWLPDDQTATYELPAEWNDRFDLITTYFVLEHVDFPTDHLRKLRTMLADGGRVFAMVPNALGNTGDVLVVDHVNHFTATSLRQACELAGLEVESIDETGFYGALAVVARRVEGVEEQPQADAVAASVAGLGAACAMWDAARTHLVDAIDERKGKALAIHGAGFHGAFMLQRIGDRGDVRVVLDGNPHLQGGAFFGHPVVAPTALPGDIESVFVALNPALARSIVGDGGIYGRPGIDLVYFDRT